jgi:hypothetical protein
MLRAIQILAFLALAAVAVILCYYAGALVLFWVVRHFFTGV